MNAEEVKKLNFFRIFNFFQADLIYKNKFEQKRLPLDGEAGAVGD